MSGKYFGFLILIFLVLLSWQLHGGFYFLGARLNFFLLALIALGFFLENPFQYLSLVLLGGFWLRFEPGWSLEIGVLTVLVLLAYWLRQRIMWPGLITNTLFIILATLSFYLLTNPGFVYHNGALVFTEVLGNVLLGAFLFEGLSFFYGKKTRSTI